MIKSKSGLFLKRYFHRFCIITHQKGEITSPKCWDLRSCLGRRRFECLWDIEMRSLFSAVSPNFPERSKQRIQRHPVSLVTHQTSSHLPLWVPKPGKFSYFLSLIWTDFTLNTSLILFLYQLQVEDILFKASWFIFQVLPHLTEVKIIKLFFLLHYSRLRKAWFIKVLNMEGARELLC